MMRFAVLLVALAVLAGACAPAAEEPAAPPPADETPAETPANGDEMTFEGTLTGDPDLEGGCVWVETAEGNYEVVTWPEGYRAEVAPVQLVGPDGEIIAEAGDRLRISGRVAEDMASICMVGTLFEADSVEPA